jgi:hypothetical protein
MGVETRSLTKAHYPTKAKIKAAVEVARELKLDVAGFEVSPDGSIRIFESRAQPKPGNEFDRWESEL